jgi:hypothetical protein
MRAPAIVLCLLLAALPAVAQNSDPFRSAAPPAPEPAPRPRPAPRVVEPESAVVVPLPAPAPVQPPPQPVAASVPNLPSASQIWARVRQIGQAEGIAIPLASNPPFDEAGTRPQYRGLLGAWGPGIWQGDPGGDKVILVVQGVDGENSLRGVVGTNGGKVAPAIWRAINSPIAGNRFPIHLSYDGSLTQTRHFEEDWSVELRPDGKLYGTRNGNASTIVLSRLQ